MNAVHGPFRGTEEPATGVFHSAAELDRRRRQGVCLKVNSALNTSGRRLLQLDRQTGELQLDLTAFRS
jgi:hypothetical protein